MQVQILPPETLVRFRGPGPGERGLWKITGHTWTGPQDARRLAYDLRSTAHGRSRTVLPSRLRVASKREQRAYAEQTRQTWAKGGRPAITGQSTIG